MKRRFRNGEGLVARATYYARRTKQQDPSRNAREQVLAEARASTGLPLASINVERPMSSPARTPSVAPDVAGELRKELKRLRRLP
jgi:hypothetical protein